MIGVISRPDQTSVVEEFFELFKTPWEFYRPVETYDVVIATSDEIPEGDIRLLLVFGSDSKRIDSRVGIVPGGRRKRATLNDRDTSFPIYGEVLTFTDASEGFPCVTAGSESAGLKIRSADSTVIRLGYDFFDEVQFLLVTGQPPEEAGTPTLEIHIQMLREWMLEAGISFLEIPPVPAGHNFAVCLTHDIDFVGIKRHKFDHSMWGFVYRSTFGALRNFMRKRLSWSRLLKSWRAALSLPFVYVGSARDFWEPFEWYLEVEKNFGATYFLIPFKRRPGNKVEGSHASRRATAYDISDITESTELLQRQGCELGVHGIDAWHDADRGREELARISAVMNRAHVGIRMHWLLRDANTPSALERAGYAYDSTFGYNETVGYRGGTTQVFRPLGARTLLELPLHIQDGALFYPQRLDLTEPEAEKRCAAIIDDAGKFGGVLTVLWHDRSHGPERFWGDFYIGLLQALKLRDVWFGTATEVVNWFRKRREVHFETVKSSSGSRMRLRYSGEKIEPPLRIRVYRASGEHGADMLQSRPEMTFDDIPWDGKSAQELELLSAPPSGKTPHFAPGTLS